MGETNKTITAVTEEILAQMTKSSVLKINIKNKINLVYLANAAEQK